MESSPSKSSIKSPSTEFSDEFVDIVNEINDFIHVLEVRQKEIAEGSPKPAESRGCILDIQGQIIDQIPGQNPILRQIQDPIQNQIFSVIL